MSDIHYICPSRTESPARAARLGAGAFALLLVALGVLLALPGRSYAADGVVNVYSYRQPYLIEPIFEAFTEETGIKVNMLYAGTGLVERLKEEGANSPADLFITADIARLIEMVDAGLAQPVANETIEANIPADLRDPAGLWVALTMRARVIYASKARVEPGSVTEYADLADPEWKGKVCTRPGDHPYNLGLIATLIARNGVEATRTWLEGVKANLVQKPQGNDRSQIASIAQGLCDLALGNSYYMGKMLSDPKLKVTAEASYIVFPDQDQGGTHVNVSGAAVTKAAPNRENAVRLLAFMTGEEAQEIYASKNFEYPVKPGVPLAPIVAAWGSFKPDTSDLAAIVSRRGEALELVNEVNYNAGP